MLFYFVGTTELLFDVATAYILLSMSMSQQTVSHCRTDISDIRRVFNLYDNRSYFYIAVVLLFTVVVLCSYSRLQINFSKFLLDH